MKKLICYSVLFLLLKPGLSGASFSSPDILLDSNLNYDWSGVLIKRIQNLLGEFGTPDPFKREFPDRTFMTEASVGKYLKPGARELVRDIGTVLGLDSLRARTGVELHGFSYSIEDFKTEVRATEQADNGIVIGSDFSAGRLRLGLGKLTFSLTVPTLNGTPGPVIKIDVIRPRIEATGDRLVNFFAEFLVEDRGDHFGIRFRRTSFDQMAKGLLDDPSKVKLSYDEIVIPEVSISVGRKTVNFSRERILAKFHERETALKELLLAQLAEKLNAGAGNGALKIAEKARFSKEYWLDTENLASKFRFQRFSSTFESNNLEISLPADFCTLDSWKQTSDNCTRLKASRLAESRLTPQLHQSSLREIRRVMKKPDTSLVASISEDYINKLLVTTYDAGLWKAALDEAGVELGPSKVILHLDRAGETARLYMDVIYKPTNLERTLIGSRTVRFPLVLEVGIRIVNFYGEPVVIIRLHDVDLSDDTLNRGKPDLGLESTIGKIPRFRGQVIKKIRKRVEVLKNKDVFELRFPEWRGFGLEKVDFSSDGTGRMNALMRVEDFFEE